MRIQNRHVNNHLLNGCAGIELDLDLLYTNNNSLPNAYISFADSTVTVHKLLSDQTMSEHLVGRFLSNMLSPFSGIWGTGLSRPRSFKMQSSFSVQNGDFKWRVIGSIAIDLICIAGASITSIFSYALSAATITYLFGMTFGLVLVTILLVFVPPSKIQGKFSMSNPWVAIPFSFLTSFLAALLSRVILTK